MKNKPSIKSLVLILCVLTCVCCLNFVSSSRALAQESTKEDESLYVARKAFEDEFYDVSLGLLERFLNNYPASLRRSEAELLIGRCYFQQNKFLDALNKFESLLNDSRARNIKDALYYWIAEVHFKGNNFDKAANSYRKVIDEFPKSPYVSSAVYSLGWCLFQEGKFSDALGFFKTVEEKYSREPQAKEAPFKIIECYYNLKDYSGLKDSARKYIKVYAKDPLRLAYLYFYLAEADYYLNNFNNAIEGYDKVLSFKADEKIKSLAQLGRAWSYLKLKKYNEALNDFNRINPEGLEKRSKDVLLLGKAILMFETNKVNEAKKVYGELIKTTLDPLVLIQAYLGKAEALYNLADYQEAVNVYKEALDKAALEPIPQEIIDKLHYSLAWAYLKQGEFKDAIKEFQKIAKGSADNVVKVSALCQIGDAYQDAGDYSKAEDTYNSILKDYPESFYSDYVQYQLGLVFLKKSNYDAAILSFLAMKRNFPASKLLDEAAYALGLAYFQRQDYNASREVFEKFDQEFKESNLKPQALYLLGTSYFNLKKFDAAIEVFKNIIRLYGQDIQLAQKAEYEIADCYYQMGNENEAMTRFQALRSKYPNSTLTPEIMWWLAGYYYRHNDLALSRRYLTSLIRDFEQSSLVPDAYYSLGSSWEAELRHEEAIANFKKVIELDKSDLAAQAAINISDIYVKQDKIDLALKSYKDIIGSFPNLTSLIYPKIAELYYKAGNFNEALKYFNQSLEIVPVKEIAYIQFKIAEVLQAKGELDEAVEEYLKASYVYSEDNSLSLKSLLRVAGIYENKENYKEALKIYNRIISMKVEEAKFAQERIDWIKAHVKKGGF